MAQQLLIVALVATLVARMSSSELTLEQRVQNLENQMSMLTTCMTGTIAMDSTYLTPGPEDCVNIYMENDIHTNGVNNIYPKNSVPFNVYCHFDDDGQWTLVQRRIDHTCSFERSWAEYKRGFGMMDAESNYWIGLEQLHILTNQAQYTVRMDIMDWDGTMKFAEYNYFKVASEADGYMLDYQGYRGTAGDAMQLYHMGVRFSTFDMDNDNTPHDHCARTHRGGWWYRDCDHANLNGQYKMEGQMEESADTGIEWDAWKEQYSFKSSMIRIKPTFGHL